MSRSVTTTRVCDRCEAYAVEDPQLGLDGWGRMVGRRLGGKEGGIGTAEAPADVCPDCLASMLAWFANPNDDPPPPAPFTLEDRKLAIAIAEAGLRQRVIYALEVVRNEPTAILSGELIPGTLYDIDATAAGMVDGILDVLGFSQGGTPRRKRAAPGGDRSAPPFTDPDTPTAVTAGASAPHGRPVETKRSRPKAGVHPS